MAQHCNQIDANGWPSGNELLKLDLGLDFYAPNASMPMATNLDHTLAQCDEAGDHALPQVIRTNHHWVGASFVAVLNL